MAALAHMIEQRPIAAYLKVMTDPGLATLRDRKELAALVASTPGTAKLTGQPGFLGESQGMYAAYLPSASALVVGGERWSDESCSSGDAWITLVALPR
jgi:hypothetical protein